MLRSIKCSGFKSFENFSIDFRPGLNVVVGPNGSGKTNIILFLQFISILRRSPLVEAIGQIGGAGSVFRRDNYRLQETIEFSLFGEGKYLDYPSSTLIYARYELSASIKLDMRENTIIFSQQRLRIWDDPDDMGELDIFGHSTATLDIECSVDDKGLPNTIINKISKKHIRYLPKNEMPYATRQIQEMAEQYSKSALVTAFLDRLLSHIDYPDQDIRGAQSYNIIPDRVRETEDMASTPIIKPDGSGLAATLYALQTQHGSVDRRFAPFFIARREFENAAAIKRQIVEYSKLVNDSVQDISVVPEPLEGKLRISVRLRYPTYSSSIPFSLVSDGTAKWFALVTAVMTNKRLFAIEEPENFLHPAMQSEIVNLVRNQYSTGEAEGFAIITTHSETILNNTMPEELVVVSMKDGRTIAKRPDNVSDIAEEIRRTGFGLGYYYIAGAIE